MRARNLKPGIYKNHDLALLGDSSFRLFTGLWGMADRKGRLEDNIGKIQAELFPFRFQKVKVDELLNGLAQEPDPFIIRYEVKGERYIQIVNFSEHQKPHPKEIESDIPPCRKKFEPRLDPDHIRDTPNPSGSSLSSSPSLSSGSSESPLLKTSSAKAASPFWQKIIDHIDLRWTWKKNGARYLWSGKDFAALKRVLTIYQPWDVMALYDVFIMSADPFAIRQGFSVMVFVRLLPVVVDGSWKPSAEKYHDQLEGPIPGDINKIVAGIAVKEMPR